MCAPARRVVYSMRHGGLRGQLYNLGDSRRAVEQRDLRRLRGGRRSCGRFRQSTKMLRRFVSIVFETARMKTVGLTVGCSARRSLDGMGR